MLSCLCPSDQLNSDWSMYIRYISKAVANLAKGAEDFTANEGFIAAHYHFQ